MAVYTVLPRPYVEAMAAVFPDVGEVKDVAGVAHGSINTTYRVTTTTGLWFLRVNEGKEFSALLHERDLLAALDDAGLDARLGVAAPRMARSVPGGSFFPIDLDDGRPRRWASFFAGLPGRDLGPFEVTPAHARQVGRFLAHAHLALRGFRRRRRNPYGVPVVHGWLRTLHEQGVAPDAVTRLTSAVRALRRARRPLPAGVVHGDVFIDNTKWSAKEAGREDARLVAVFDWEMAGRDHLLLDVCITACAWGFRRDDAGAMVLVDDVVAALVDGYRAVRPFAPSERRALFVEWRLAAIRFAASRLRDFEAPARHGDAAERRYLDYRDFVARLDVLEGRGERALKMIFGV